MPSQTPEFIAFALVQRCDLRGGRDPDEPLQVERHLRPLRAYGDAVAEQRIFDGLVVEWPSPVSSESPSPPLGFRAAEMFTAYGGREHVANLCGTCPACVVSPPTVPPLARCFGWLTPDSQDAPLRDQWSRAIEQRALASNIREVFLPTHPTWYGLWAQSPLTVAQLHVHRRIALALIETSASNAATQLALHSQRSQPLRHWLATVQTAIDRKLDLRVVLVPAGSVQGRRWTTEAHCERCRAPRSNARRPCPSCGITGHTVPQRTRCARGTRPYQPLAAILGPERARQFCEQYALFR